MQYKSSLNHILNLFHSYGSRIDIFCDMYEIEAQRYEYIGMNTDSFDMAFFDYQEKPKYSLGFTLTKDSPRLPLVLQLIQPMANLITQVIDNEDNNGPHVKLLSPADILFFIDAIDGCDFVSLTYHSISIEITTEIGHVWEGIILTPNEVEVISQHFKNAVTLTGQYR